MHIWFKIRFLNTTFYQLIFYFLDVTIFAMKKLASFLLGVSPIFSAQLSVDRYLSPYTGADLCMSATQYQMDVEDSLKGFVQPEEESWISSGLSGTYRFATIVAWWAPTSMIEMLSQHEIFGHGFRVREFGKFGYRISHYSFFDSDSVLASTTFYRPDLEQPFLENVIAFGGTEANTVLAGRMRENFFEKGCIDGRLAPLYGFSNGDLSEYIQTTAKQIEDNESLNDGNDIQSYLKTVNQLNPDSPVTIQQLKKLSYLTLLDPFNWGSQCSLFSYILFGKELPIPVFQKGPFRFVPSVSPNLTPFGPEVIVEQYFSIGTKPQRSYIRFTPYNNRGILGAGYKNLYLKTIDDTHFGCVLDAWIAPKIRDISTSGVYFTKQSPMRPGVQALFTVRQSIDFKAHCKCGFDIGAKTTGYLIGTPIEKGVVVRLTLDVEF